MMDGNNPASDSGRTPAPRLGKQNQIRSFLRTAGPLVLLVGLVCVGVATASMFGAFESSSFGPPKYFWLAFIGLPLLFVGSVMTMNGYMRELMRFQAGEAAPVAADAVNYMANETKDAMQTVAKSAAKGIAEGIEAGRWTKTNFCPHCGGSVTADFKFCPNCGKLLGA
jgi:hypothetical protein